jgi:hypothetical protein
MTDSSVPPPPTRGASPALTIVVVLMLAGIAALLWWRSGQDEESAGETSMGQVAASPSSASAGLPAPPVVVHAPPPPPPPVEEAAPAGEVPASSSSDPGQKGAPDVRRASPCGGDCGGTAPPELHAALSARAQQARSCYQAALRQGASGEGRVVVAVRVAQNGAACSVSLAADTLGNPGVSSCVTAKFRSGSYPLPKGGCVDTQVPINFVSKP